MTAALREALAPDGQAKQLLSIQTFSVDMARSIWPEADLRDVGDLRMYFDWRNPDEVEAARAAFEAAQRKGVAFFRIDDLEGEQITDFDDALRVAQGEAGAAEKPPAAGNDDQDSVPEPPRRRGRRGPSRIQGVPPVRGGRG